MLSKWRSGRGSNPRPPPWQGGILNQLNYQTIWYNIMVTDTGFEPVNACVKGMWVNRFSNPPTKWWSLAGSNRWPPACKAGALPAELKPHFNYTWWAWMDLNHRPHPYQGCALTNWATGPSRWLLTYNSMEVLIRQQQICIFLWLFKSSFWPLKITFS